MSSMEIAEILSAKTAKGCNDHDFMDMTDKTVMPGLIDAHVHLDLCGMNTFEENVQSDAYRTMRALSLARDNLMRGYTTLRDVGDRNDITISLAQAVDEGMVLAPDIYPSGRIISPTESGNNFFGSMYLEADSPAEFRKAVRKQHQAGAKWIKVMATGAIMNSGGEPGNPIIMEEMQEVCRTADYLNLPVAIHCHDVDGIKMAIRCGVRTVEHSSIMDDEVIRMYMATNRTYPIPTFAPMTNFLEFSVGKPKHYVDKARKLRITMIDSMRAAYEAGIKMGWAPMLVFM